MHDKPTHTRLDDHRASEQWGTDHITEAGPMPRHVMRSYQFPHETRTFYCLACTKTSPPNSYVPWPCEHAEEDQ